MQTRSEKAAVNEMKKRSIGIDCLKTVAVVSVVLYHMGIFSKGYLGVDCFLVIAGYLTAKSIMKSMDNEKFSYIKFLVNRIVRLLPMIILATTVCLVIGYFIMLPDDFENLCESIVATNIFANNVLQCITTNNYWDVVNEYKPLMHTWYLGILMQSYFVLPWIFMIARKINKEAYKKVAAKITLIIMAVSFAMYVMPFFPDAEKFYYLPFRIFEVLVGVIAAGVVEVNFGFTPIAWLSKLKILYSGGGKTLVLISYIGRASLSIYMWHQILLAFIRYAVKTDFNLLDNLIYVVFVSVVSFFSYFFIEKLKYENNKEKLKLNITLVMFALGSLFVVVNVSSLIFYMRAGVVRDVPELDIYKDTYSRGMHAEYNSRIREYSNDFGENDLLHVLIIGDSFARDWGNILLESGLADKIELSYIEGNGENLNARKRKLCDEADRVFWAVAGFRDIPNDLCEYYDAGKLFIVGNKLFGESNGIAYNQKRDEQYYDFHVTLEPEFMIQNEEQSKKYGNQYIDMMKVVKNEDGTISIYTQNHKYISQDCRHLTMNGAVFYAEVLDLRGILN